MDVEKLRKIDALIAEKVMGWERWECRPGSTVWIDENGRVKRAAEPSSVDFCSCEVFSPSTDISDAWKVVEKLRKSLIFQFGDAWDENDKKVYSANFQYNDSYTWQNYEAYAETAPLAICMAALKAIGVDIEKEVK